MSLDEPPPTHRREAAEKLPGEGGSSGTTLGGSGQEPRPREFAGIAIVVNDGLRWSRYEREYTFHGFYEVFEGDGVEERTIVVATRTSVIRAERGERSGWKGSP